MMTRLVLFLALAACGGSSSQPSASTAPAAATPAPAAATPVPAKPAEPAPAAEIGPDGPADIPVPASIPKTSAELPSDEATLKKGEEVYTNKGCGACHQIETKLIGPALKGVAQRRTPHWIARMVLEPDKMIKTDPVAKQLYAEMMTPMAKQNVEEADLLPLIAYLNSHK